jgi:phage repressor protein C with HTH and peptisase S24 domain
MPSRSVRCGEEVTGTKLDTSRSRVGENLGLDVIGDRSAGLPALHGGNRPADHSRHGPDPTKPIDDASNVCHDRECSLVAYTLSTAKCVRTGRQERAHIAYMADEHVALRVKALRKRAGLSVRKAAEEMGLKASSYGHYEDPARLKGPHLPMAFAQGFAAMLSRHGIPAEDVLALAGAGEIPWSVPDATEGPVDLIPVYDVQASAGPGFIVDGEDYVTSLAFPQDYLRRLTRANPRNLQIITVKGDSMFPTINDDDVVLLDVSKRDLSYDGLFVVRDNGAGLLVKRIGRASQSGHVMMISDNKAYSSVERPMSEIEVIGKVLWRGGKL